MRFIVIGLAATLAFAGYAAADVYGNQNNLVTFHLEGTVNQDANIYCENGEVVVDTTPTYGHRKSMLGDFFFNGVNEDYGDCGDAGLVVDLVKITGDIMGSGFDVLDLLHDCTPDLDDLGNPYHDCTGLGAEVEGLLP
ncbi:MAG TPA: hypothetical protein VI997_05905 [Candidatus Thermoplasmatota archaeon]|nr:hypothetical protein [Candidatus Thermoplasmatota archaeon]